MFQVCRFNLIPEVAQMVSAQKKEKCILSIGLAVLDVTAYPVGAEHPWKDKQQIEGIRMQIGGDAANQSIHLSSLGWKVCFCGCAGSDYQGNVLRQSLERAGVDTSFLRIREGKPTGTALILVDEKGSRHVFSSPGVHRTICRKDLPEKLPENLAAVTLGSLFGMPELEADGMEDYLKTVKAAGALVFADLNSGRVTGDCPQILRLLPWIDYLMPSDYDLTAMTGYDDPADGAAFLQDRGAGSVIVKRGGQGCDLFRDGQRVHLDAVPVRPVDTTGAGDCMCAAFLSGILDGNSPEEACRTACRAASYSTLHYGAAEYPLKKLMQDLAEKDDGNDVQ